jgi:hypothetical protein
MTVLHVGILCFVAGLMLGALLMSRPEKRRQAAVARSVSAPAPGEAWVLALDAKGPWPYDAQPYKPVRVRDVRDGWVRYAIGSTYPDERATVESFTRMYRKAT